ncbi:SepL/TyeA/HrpJ family type III secretion system gatekeeper [Pseudomonas sp. 18.1.10]|uniref:HrpJ domain-containing protein n=1 Tax=Pseudomonas sp. 18.1.10 TaxID=2969302 RepID=UPI00215027E8|nr:HrpJ domain-containing protein [Pseudomonas sp. 18.1.10]MCR4538184.1 SepL/TyeA/HrpJ family type III secretion system gatekeeper [Pseudomonas sp. 18.1.10]
MKVESHSDVQTVQHLDKPVVSNASVPEPAKGSDELALLFNQEVELNKLPLAQRQMGLRVPPAEKMVQLYDQLGHPAQASMASISRLIRMLLLQKANIDELLAEVGGDPARAFVVLKHVAAHADAEARRPEADAARAAIANLEAKYEREILAGLNTARSLQAASVDPQERQALRSLYYASVVTRQSLTTMMQTLLGVYGGERFHEGLNVMRKALVDDIAAKKSSMDKPLLHSLLLGLRSCGQLGSVLAGCLALKLRLGIEQEAVTLLQRLLGYANSGIAAEEILLLGQEMGGSLRPRRLVALNALFPLFRELPMALWPDSRVREETLFTFIALMDELNRSDGGTQRFPNMAGA